MTIGRLKQTLFACGALILGASPLVLAVGKTAGLEVRTGVRLAFFLGIACLVIGALPSSHKERAGMAAGQDGQAYVQWRRRARRRYAIAGVCALLAFAVGRVAAAVEALDHESLNLALGAAAFLGVAYLHKAFDLRARGRQAWRWGRST